MAAFLTSLLLCLLSAASTSASGNPRLSRQRREVARASPPGPSDSFGCKYQTYKQRLDHFDSSNSAIFSQKYVVCDAVWSKSASNNKPKTLLFFLGNESPLGTLSQPIVFENAERLNAAVVAVEHRYYGESMPFPLAPGEAMLPTPQYAWLTIEQVMEDSRTVLQAVRKQLGVDDAVPAVVIGGSYGGMLATYHRVAYPEVYGSAVAASAPITYVHGTPAWASTSQGYYVHITRSAATNGSPRCAAIARRAMAQVVALAKTAGGRAQVARTFKRCSPDQAFPAPQDALDFVGNLLGGFEGAAQLHGQYSDGTVLQDMTALCSAITDAAAGGASDMEALSAGDMYMSGVSGSCAGYSPASYRQIGDPQYDAGTASYSYQCCTQGFVFSSGLPSNGSADAMSPSFKASGQALRSECLQAFGPAVPDLKPSNVTVNVLQLLKEVGGVVFTNGDLDGWAGGSLLSPLPGAKNVAHITYPRASHCTDTHSYNWGNPSEPGSYKALRAKALDLAVGFARRPAPSR